MKDKYLDLARELKKLEYAGDNYTNCNWCFWYTNKRITKGMEDLEVGERIENCQNIEKSPGDLRRLVVTQTPVEDHQH